MTTTMNLPRGSLLWILLATSVAPVSLVTVLTLQKGPWWVPLLVISAVALAPPLAVRLLCYPMGWFALARQFPPAPGAALPWQASLTSIALRRRYLGMNNCIAWASDDDALHLMLDAPFGWGMPKIMIPWSAVASIGPAKTVGRMKPQTFEIIGADATPLPVRVFLARELVAAELAVREELALSEPSLH